MTMSEGTKALPKIIATSVAQGNQQGESHYEVYLVDFERQNAIHGMEAWSYESLLDS